TKAELGAKQDAATAATDAELAAHAEDSTNVHGIADTADLATKAELPETITWRETYTFTIPDEVLVPTGDENFIPPFFVMLDTGQTAEVISCRHRINSGTSATVKLQKNGVDLTGFTNISVTTNAATTDPANQSLESGDRIGLVVTAVNGTQKNLSLS